MSKSSLNALEYASCLQVTVVSSGAVPMHWFQCLCLQCNCKVKMKAIEIGVTDASADNLRRVGFPEKMSGSDDRRS